MYVRWSLVSPSQPPTKPSQRTAYDLTHHSHCDILITNGQVIRWTAALNDILYQVNQAVVVVWVSNCCEGSQPGL